MKKRNFIIIVMLVTMFLGGCSFYPKWYRNPSKDQNSVYLYGHAVKEGSVTSYESAKAMAYNDAAQYIENYLMSMTRDWIKETGTKDADLMQDTERVIKMVSKQKFSGGLVVKEDHKFKKGKEWCFVRLELPSKEVKKQLVNHIRSEESLYNEWKSKQAYKDLEIEIEKY